MPVAKQILLQFARGNIGQLTYIEAATWEYAAAARRLSGVVHRRDSREAERGDESGVATCGDARAAFGARRFRVPGVVIRDVPDDVIAALDNHASRLGLSRGEYLRRRLAQDAATSDGPVEVADLTRFARTFGDLADPDAMSRAWQ
jgi:hypothetical protein